MPSIYYTWYLTSGKCNISRAIIKFVALVIVVVVVILLFFSCGCCHCCCLLLLLWFCLYYTTLLGQHRGENKPFRD